MTPPDELAVYNAGLGNLRIYIESRLEEAGATMGAGSVTTPDWPVQGAPPGVLKIKVIPVGGPCMEFALSDGQIAACWKGVTSSDVSGEVESVANAYTRARFVAP